MKELKINNDLLSDQDRKLLSKGGYNVSDCSDQSINYVIYLKIVI